MGRTRSFAIVHREETLEAEEEGLKRVETERGYGNHNDQRDKEVHDVILAHVLFRQKMDLLHEVAHRRVKQVDAVAVCSQHSHESGIHQRRPGP